MQLRVNIPPLTRILLGLLISISTAHQACRYLFPNIPLETLGIVPSQSIYYPWVYLTASFAEQNVVTLLIAAATLFYGGKYLERAWGSMEFGKFVLIVTLIPNIIASFLYIFWFAMTRDAEQAWIFIQGSVAYQGAFLVAFKQLVPEHTVTLLQGMVKIRVKHFPAIFLLTNTFSGLVFGTDTALVLAWAGFFTSWIYLRFIKVQVDLNDTTSSTTGGTSVDNSIKGDASETFSFASFWPDIVQPAISRLADLIYGIMVSARIINSFSTADIENGNAQASIRGEGGLPSLLTHASTKRSGKREEAERRRALALKALDQRLQAATANRQTEVPENSPASLPDAVKPALDV